MELPRNTISVYSVLIITILFQYNKNLYGQQYQTIDPNRSCIFETSETNMSVYSVLENYCPINSTCALGLIVDSVIQNSNSITFNFQKLLRGNPSSLCLDDSWLGPKSIVKSNGDEYFFNGNGDSILIKSQAPIGSEWVFFDNGDDLIFKGTIDNIVEGVTFSILDSIKEISIKRTDELGNIIPHEFNDKVIRISKEFGFLELFDFYHFPMDPTLKSLIGITNPSFGYQNLTEDKIFDYQVGFEFHYHNYFKDNFDFNTENKYIRNIVLDKTTSGNLDTISYTFDHTYYLKIYGGISDPNFYISEGRDTIQIEIIRSQYSDFSKLPFENMDSNGGGGYSMLVYNENNLAWMKTTSLNYQFDQANDPCLQELIGGDFLESNYHECLGKTRYFTTDGNNDKDDKLIYYKKGNMTWGDSIDFDLLMATEEVSPESTNLYQTYPNPVTDFINFKNCPDNSDFLVQIYDLKGSLLLSKMINRGTRINVTQLSPGTYFTKINIKNKTYSSTFAKLN